LTIRDLLSHRYGINSQPAVLLDAYTGEITEERYYHWLAEATIAGKVDYTNVHFTLLGRVIEAVTGVPWRGYLEANVFLPAGMTRTTGYASRMWADPDHAVPTARKGEGWEAHAQRKTDRTMHAAGGLATTARDGGQWLKLFLGGGMVDGHRVLTEETVADMLTLNGAFPEPDGTIRVIDGFGSAWQVGAFNGHRLAMHSGGYIGTWAHAAILPEDGAGVYVLINADGPAGGLGTIVAVDVLERLSGTTSPWSVYDRYIEQIRKKKAHDADAPAVVPSPGLAFDALPRPAKGYEGEYHNPWWGTVKVAGDGEYLTLHLGDYALDVSPVEGTPDHFTEDGLFDDATTGRFVAGADGTVTEVVLLDPERGEIEFKR
jgi:CubicO group peptidase (beta-lactamase class C family)